MLYVVIPTYNRAHTLKRALDSIRNQENANIVTVIVDDGSLDHTKQLVSNYKNEFPDFVIHYVYQSNGGVGSACNAGIDLAVQLGGSDPKSLLTILGSDDELSHGAFRAFTFYTQKYTHENVFYFQMKDKNAQGGIAQVDVLEPTKVNFQEYLQGKKISFGDCAVCVRLHILREDISLRFNSKLRHSGDEIFHHSLMRKFGSLFVPVVVYEVNSDTESLSRRILKKEDLDHMIITHQTLLDTFGSYYRLYGHKILASHYYFLAFAYSGKRQYLLASKYTLSFIQVWAKIIISEKDLRLIIQVIPRFFSILLVGLPFGLKITNLYLRTRFSK